MFMCIVACPGLDAVVGLLCVGLTRENECEKGDKPMQQFIHVWGCIVFSAGILQAAVTPMDAALTEGGITEIECPYMYTPTEANLVGSYSPAEHPMGAHLKGVCHYQLYLPSGYGKEKERKYPVLFIASAKAEPYMDNVKARAERDGWIVVMLMDSKSEDPLWLGNFVGAHDDVVKRVRVLEDVKVATGSKGGGNCASVYGAYRTGFRGYIGQGSCFWSDRSSHRYDAAKQNRDFVVYQILGPQHVSFRCREDVKRGVPKSAHHWSECVEEGGTWARTEEMDCAFDWMERQVFIEARMAKVSREAALWHHENKLTALEQAKSAFDRYELMEYISALAKKQKLTSDEAVRDKLAAFKQEMKTLEDDAAVKEELAARRLFWALVKMDGRNIDSKQKADPLVATYKAIAEKYKDTVYGRRAALRAESLKTEFKPRMLGM